MRSPKAELLIVGLGNPGPRYHETRHNAGADACSRLVHLLGGRFRRALLQRAWIARVPGAVVARPDAFMNESGPPVARLVRSFGTPLVVADDLDLAPGVIRFRTRGSAGGHNGLKSVIAALGHENFPRLKIGVGRPATREGVVDWVLTRAEGAERATLDAALDEAARALRTAVQHGLDRAMTEHSA